MARKVRIYKPMEPCALIEVKAGDVFQYLPENEDDKDDLDAFMVAVKDATPFVDGQGSTAECVSHIYTPMKDEELPSIHQRFVDRNKH